MDEETKITESSITSSGSLLERYQSVSDAIDKILQGGQSYKIGSRQLQRADLSALIKERDRLESAIVSRTSQDNPGLFDDTVVAYFDGR